jgi:hypothetical protein
MSAHQVPGQRLPGVVAEERADHEDIGVGKVDEPQHAVHHRVPERDERVDGAEREAVEELLEEFGQGGGAEGVGPASPGVNRGLGGHPAYGATVSTKRNLPSFTVITTADLVALRWASRVVCR